MQYQAGDPQRSRLPRDADVDRRRWLISELPRLCGGGVTQDRLSPGAQDRRPKQGNAWDWTAERDENALMEQLPLPRIEAPRDDVPGHSGPKSLLARQHPLLPLQLISKE